MSWLTSKSSGLSHRRTPLLRIADDRLCVTASASVNARTGVEMEALVAVAVACLTLYDMTKAVDKNLRIEAVELVEKVKADK